MSRKATSRSDVQRALREIAIALQGIFQFFHNLKYPLGIIIQNIPHIRKLKFLAGFAKEFDTKILLKGLYLHGNRWLGDMERMGGFGDAFFFGD